VILRTFRYEDVSVEIVEDDITRQETDIIVNAANSYLRHGGGVAGAIVKAGGEEIQKESDEYIEKYGSVPVSGVAVTGAGKLRARYIFHAVGPVWGEGNEHVKLYNTVKNVLLKANELREKSISIPAISSGTFGFPKKDCAEIFLRAIKDYLISCKDNSLKTIRICNIDHQTCQIFLETFERFWGW
jgi:putative ATPase